MVLGNNWLEGKIYECIKKKKKEKLNQRVKNFYQSYQDLYNIIYIILLIF